MRRFCTKARWPEIISALSSVPQADSQMVFIQRQEEIGTFVEFGVRIGITTEMSCGAEALLFEEIVQIVNNNRDYEIIPSPSYN